MKNFCVFLISLMALSCNSLKRERCGDANSVYPLILNYLSQDLDLLDFANGNNIKNINIPIKFEIGNENFPIDYWIFWNDISSHLRSHSTLLSTESKYISVLDSLSTRSEHNAQVGCKLSYNNLKEYNYSDSPLKLFISCIDDDFISVQVYVKKGNNNYPEIAFLNGGNAYLFKIDKQGQIEKVFKGIYSID